jgi:hypothetical protein
VVNPNVGMGFKGGHAAQVLEGYTREKNGMTSLVLSVKADDGVPMTIPEADLHVVNRAAEIRKYHMHSTGGTELASIQKRMNGHDICRSMLWVNKQDFASRGSQV